MPNPNTFDPTGANTADPGAGTGAGSSGSSTGSTGGGGGLSPRGAGGGGLMAPPMAEFFVSSNSITIPAPGESFRVPAGAHVEVWPDPSNTGNVAVSDLGASAVKNSPRAVLTPGSSGRIYRVDNVARLWILSITTAADKVVIRVVSDR